VISLLDQNVMGSSKSAVPRPRHSDTIGRYIQAPASHGFPVSDFRRNGAIQASLV